MELKSTVPEIKNSVEGLNRQKKESANLKDKSIEMIKSEEQK